MELGPKGSPKLTPNTLRLHIQQYPTNQHIYIHTYTPCYNTNGGVLTFFKLEETSRLRWRILKLPSISFSSSSPFFLPSSSSSLSPSLGRLKGERECLCECECVSEMIHMGNNPMCLTPPKKVTTHDLIGQWNSQ